MSHCREFEDVLPLHAVGETGLDEALAVEEHLAGCPACRDEVVALRELSVSLRRELGDVPAVPDPWLAGASTPGTRWPAWALAGWRGVALAAGLLLAGILVGRWSVPEQAGQRLPIPAVSTARDLDRPLAFSVFSPAARRFLSEAAHRKGQAILPARTQP
jgi:predicted anti-sigma-YlaC factor YlaD